MTVVFSLGLAARPMLAMLPQKFVVRVSQVEDVAAEIVDRAGPLRVFERPLAEVEPFAQEHARGAQLLDTQSRILAGHARRPRSRGLASMSIAIVPTPPVAPVTTISPPSRMLAVLLHAMDRERRGEARGADRHALELVESRRDRDDPVALHARVFGVTAVVGLGQAAAVDQDFLPGLEARVLRGHDFAGEVDAADQRIFAQDLAGAGRRERVLVVDASSSSP